MPALRPRGLHASGAALQAEQTFGSGLAASDFGNYWNRLQQLSGSGLDAAKGIASAATGGATNIANTDIGQAGADASIYGNMAKSIGTSANGLMNNQGFQNWLGGSGGGGGSVYSDPVGSTSMQVNPATGLSYQSSTDPSRNWQL